MSISKVEHNHFYDLLAPESLFNPYPLYAQLREQEPVYFYEPGDFWLLTRYKDVETGFIDPRLSSKKEDSYVKLLGDLSPDIIRNYLKLI